MTTVRLLTLLVVGLMSPGCGFPWDEWRGNIHYSETTLTGGTGREQGLYAQVSMQVGELTIEPGPSDLAFEARFHYNDMALEPRADFETDESGVARLSVSLEGEAHSFHSWGKNSIHLRLNPRIPLKLRTETGVGEATIDLTGMRVESVRLQSGVGKTSLVVLEPNPVTCEFVEIDGGVGALEVTGLGNLNFREFRLRGGVGGSRIDFSGSWPVLGKVTVEVGVGGVDLLVPGDLPVVIEAEGNMFSNVSVPDAFSRRGNRYTSPSAENSSSFLEVRIAAGIGGANVRWR